MVSTIAGSAEESAHAEEAAACAEQEAACAADVCCKTPPTYNMVDFARTLNWVTQDILPHHRWVLDIEANCFDNIRVNLVGLKENGLFNREPIHEMDSLTPDMKDSILRVFSRYFRAEVLGGEGPVPDPDPVVPIAMTFKPFAGKSSNFVLSAEVMPPPSPWVERDRQFPVLSRVIKPLRYRFNREGILAEMKQQGFGDLSDLRQKELLEFRRAAFGLYPLNKLTIYSARLRDDLWRETHPPIAKKDRDDLSSPSP